MIHEGKILHKLLKSKGIGETKVSKEFKISRRAIYNYYKSENLSNKVKQRFLDCFGIDVNRHIHSGNYDLIEGENLVNEPSLSISSLRTIVKDQQRHIDQLKAASEEKDKRIASLEELLKVAINNKSGKGPEPNS